MIVYFYQLDENSKINNETNNQTNNNQTDNNQTDNNQTDNNQTENETTTDKNETKNETKSLEVNVKYFETLENTLTRFNELYRQTADQDDVEEVFNQYGQKIPLVYRIQKTGLKVYYR